MKLPNFSSILLAVVFITSSPAAFCENWGSFNGPVRAEFLPDGRSMKLVEDLIYTDPNGVQWRSPRGSIVDGASIPFVFWSVIGGPFEGLYRDASVIHDVACDKRVVPWQKVHRVFYQAMRCRNVAETKAKLMFYAVYHFGPRWGVGPALNKLFFDEETANPADVQQIEQWIQQSNPDLEVIENAKSQAENLPTR